ncbi:MAG: hypothetical protein V1787_02895 [Candidatus Micrarchaeota archaeon]
MDLDEAREWFDETFESPATRGLVVLAVLLVAAFAVAYLVIRPFSGPKYSSLEVSVLSESGEAVPGALVRLFDSSGNLLEEQKTGADGTVSFASVPQRAFVRASKAGFEEASAAAVGGSIRLELPAEAGLPQKVSAEVLVSDSASGKPVAGAKVAFSVKGGKSAEASTDAGGKAVLSVPENRLISVSVSHPDYTGTTVSFQAKKQSKPIEIKLAKLPAGAARSTPRPAGTEFEFGSLEVTVSDGDGRPVDGAAVEISDASTNSPLDSKQTVNGRAVFDELAIGSGVFLSVTAEGFAASAGRQKLTIVRTTRYEVVLRREGESGSSFRVRTTDEAGEKIAAEVRFYSASMNRLLKRASGSGDASFSIEDAKSALGGEFSDSDSYYVSASFAGMLPAASERFPAPFSQDVTLQLKTAGDNAADLSVRALDEDRTPLSTASIRVSDYLGAILYEADSPDRTFLLATGEKYRVEIENAGRNGYGRVLLVGDMELDVWLGGQLAFLLVSAVDAFTGKPVKADFTSSYGDAEFDACTGTACFLRLNPFAEASVKAFAGGYETYETTSTAGAEDESLLELSLVPSESGKPVFVKLAGVFDALGQNVETIAAGMPYTAKILLSSKDALKTGVFFRVGEDGASSITSISGFSSKSTATEAVSSVSFNPSTPCRSADGIVKDAQWASVSYAGGVSEEVEFKFSLKQALAGKKTVTLHYRGFALQSGGAYARFPDDPDLGTSESTASKGGCYAEAFSAQFPLEELKDFKCKQLGCLSLTLEQDGLEGREGFQARTIPGCDSVCTDCENSCSLAALQAKFTFEPSPAYAASEFDFTVRHGGKLEFTGATVNNAALAGIQKSSATGTLSDTKTYDVSISSNPLAQGDETVTVELWKKDDEDRKMTDSVSFRILEGCGARMRRCDDGTCTYFCIPSITSSPTPSPEPTPRCPAGKTFCIDGVCRTDCGILSPSATPQPTVQPQACTEDYYCDTGYCNPQTHECDTRGCSSSSQCPEGQDCVGGECRPRPCTTDFQCLNGMVCNPPGVCTEPPTPCSTAGDCSPGYCDSATNLCVFPSPTPVPTGTTSPTPTASAIPCAYNWECYPQTCNTAAGQCNAATATPVPTSTEPASPTPSEDPTATPSPDLTIDIVNGRLVSSVNSIAMKVDAVMPADAAVIKITAKCRTPFVAVDSEKGTSSCYSFAGSVLKFASQAFNGQCPLAFKGDKLEADEGKLRISCTGDAANTLEIPIRVTVDDSVKAVYIRPAALSGSSSKLFHIVSQTQARRELSLNNDLRSSFEKSNALTYAWSGRDGKVSATENGGLAGEVFYGPIETYFPNIDDQGGRVESCSDFFCCAEGWCTAGAAGQAFGFFKQAAKAVADKTAFRDGRRLPLKHFTDKPFVYTTVMRLVEGAALPSGIYAADSPGAYGCKASNPKAYVVQASSYDGESWDYVARIARLYRYNYVSPPAGGPQCPSSDSTPALAGSNVYPPQQSGGFLALCDFLTGKPECIDSTEDSTLASAEQVKEKKSLTPILIPSTFWQIPFKKHSCDALAITLTTEWNIKIAVCNPYLALPVGGELLWTSCAMQFWAETQAEAEAAGAALTTVDVDLPGVFPLLRITGLACPCFVLPPIPTGPNEVICIPTCKAKRSYVVSGICGNKLYAITHMGVNTACMTDFKILGLAAVQLGVTYKYPEYSSYISILSTLATIEWGIEDPETPLVLKALEKVLPIKLSKSPSMKYALSQAIESVFYTQLCKKLGA